LEPYSLFLHKYIERLVKNQFIGSYFDFWPLKAFIGIYPNGNISWHHLWFLPYLLLFSLTLIPVFLYFNTHPHNRFGSWLKQLVENPFGLYVFVVPLYIAEAFIEPHFQVTRKLVGDWFAIINFMTLFFYGFLLITVKDTFWVTVENYRWTFLITGIVSFTIMLLLPLNFEDNYARHYTEALFKVLNLWSWILTLFGFAAKYLNKRSKILSYSNEAVYPFYILHQTVMLVIAYFLIDLYWYLEWKASVMIIGTFGMSWLLYEFLIRRWKHIRPFFGLKKKY
jgi:glucan biosynthesis protein C